MVRIAKLTPVAHLTFAGLSIAAQTEAGAAAAGPRLVSVPQETDVRAAASFPKLIQLTSVATHWTARTDATEPGTLAQDTLCVCGGGGCVEGGGAYLEAGVSGGRRGALPPCPPWSPLGNRCC